MSFVFSQFSMETCQLIFQDHPDAMVVLSKEGAILATNKAACAWFGDFPTEMRRIHYQDILCSMMPEFWKDAYHNLLARVNGGERVEGYETICFRKNGTSLTAHLSLFPLRDEAGNVFGSYMIIRDMTEQKQIEASLRESEERYRKVVELSPKGILVHQQGTVVYANPFARRTLQSEQLVGRDILSFFHPDYREVSRDRFFHSEVGQELPFIETVMIRDDGKRIDVEIGGVHILRDGEPAVLSIFRDVTDRKQAEQKLSESEKRYRRLVELSPIAMLVHRDGLIQYANRSCTKLLGAASADELLQQPILDFSPPAYRDAVERRIRELDGTGISIDPTEEQVVRRDKTVIDVEVTGVSIQYEGQPAYLMMIQDITREKQAEEALRESEEKYRLIAESMTDLVTVLDETGVVKYASPSHESVLGIPPETYEGQLAFDVVHPGDVERVKQSFKQMVSTRATMTLEVQLKRFTNGWLWVEASGKPVFDERGNLLHFVIVSRDVTERKVYEKKLEHLAFHDPLTGLPNRRMFRDKFRQALEEAERHERKMAVMYMDIDKFKSINDALGHEVGDELLKQFAQRVQACLRPCDTLARQGGDEFTILLPTITLEVDAVSIAKRIFAAIQEPWKIAGQVFHTTSSVGIAFYPMDGHTRHELLRHADEALYDAKRDGRNTIKAYAMRGHANPNG
ncbi:PAS domain S-box protein [Alicyclobacillus suci]|uniref:PAS domain S-box protein n=1 Tax=Alicyclobacillus suci TaxID=2816080 RepID=UPI001A907034|nr:PAS domain S-box protein [Alicyclobacillus suci]